MGADLSELRRLAVAVREILEGNQENHDVVFENFPSGACGVTAELLARYFVEALGIDAMYVGAERDDGWTHAWITIDGVIVDITADQFGQEPVIVTENSDWHDQWNQETPRPPICSSDEWPMYPFSIWRIIVDGMKERSLPAPSKE